MGKVLLAISVLAASGPIDSTSAENGPVVLATERVAAGVSLPAGVTHAPDDPTRLFILQKTGTIRILNLETELLNAAPFLDVQGVVYNAESPEQGLLGLAFHPDYARNGRFFVHYTGQAQPGESVIAEYQRSAGDPDVADPGGDVIMTWSQPMPIHQGGWLDFGSDGLLYLAAGDGGMTENAQALDTVLGKILRIDVDGDDFPLDPDRDFAIPPDNPRAGRTSGQEIWAFGLRNPWRCAFDDLTGDLYIADVGHDSREEIDVLPAGQSNFNFGWGCREGTVCPGVKACPCDDVDYIDPIHEYAHRSFPPDCAVIGGVVYRGEAIPSLQGTYFFGDFCSGRVWSLRWNPDRGVTGFEDRSAELEPPGDDAIERITSFGTDALGEIYLCDTLGQGEVYRIISVKLPCADVDGSGVIGVDDLVAVITSWGPCRPAPAECTADVDDDGVVGVTDLVIVIEGWGVACKAG